MRISPALAASALVFVSCANAFAWNDRGHMMVGAVAWDQLSPSAKARASELLKLNPLYGKWVQSASEEDADEIAFVRAATWPDFIKRSTDYTNDGEDPSASGPDASRNIGYSDKLMHKYWHYIDLPFSTDGTETTPPKEPNAETQITAFRDTISGTATDDVKSYDLVWLLHLVGDVHQPLHATSRFSAQFPQGDSGGNGEKVCVPACGEALHAFWDDALGKSESVLGAIKAAAQLDDAPASGAAIANPQAWIVESFELAKSTVYQPIGDGKGPFTLSDDYKDDAKTIAEERVALAGARLANLLNAFLK
jgi:hypothetical protein